MGLDCLRGAVILNIALTSTIRKGVARNLLHREVLNATLIPNGKFCLEVRIMILNVETNVFM